MSLLARVGLGRGPGLLRRGAEALSAPLRAPLGVDPRPLILPGPRLVVAWSCKSACTHVVVWAFLQERLLEAADYYNGWPHAFRTEVYYASRTYQRAAEAVLERGGRGWTLLKVTRDPVRRLAAIFRHVCRYDFAWPAIDRALGTRVARHGLALAEFDRFLAGQRLRPPAAADIHLCAQRHPVAGLAFDRTITLNIDTHALEAGLNRIERGFGLPVTDFARVPKIAALRRSHYARAHAAAAPPGPLATRRFRAAEIAGFPGALIEASPLLAAMAARHHAGDADYARTGDSADALAFDPAPRRAAG